MAVQTRKIESQIIYESPLLKRGKYQNNFKSKWFILLQNHMLVYYSSETKAKADDGTCDGTISLRDVYNLSILSNGKLKRDEEWLPSSAYLRIRSHRKSSRNSIFEGIRKSAILSQQHPTPSPASPPEEQCFALQLETTNRTYVLGCSNADHFRQWVFCLERMIFGGVVHSGFLYKQGGKWKSWKKRWFLLDKELLLLKYYETEELKLWKGAIDLSLVTNLRRGAKDSNSRDFTIELDTNHRVWILAALSEEHRTLWINHFQDAIASKLPHAMYPKIPAYASSSIDNLCVSISPTATLTTFGKKVGAPHGVQRSLSTPKTPDDLPEDFPLSPPPSEQPVSVVISNTNSNSNHSGNTITVPRAKGVRFSAEPVVASPIATTTPESTPDTRVTHSSAAHSPLTPGNGTNSRPRRSLNAGDDIFRRQRSSAHSDGSHPHRQRFSGHSQGSSSSVGSEDSNEDSPSPESAEMSLQSGTMVIKQTPHLGGIMEAQNGVFPTSPLSESHTQEFSMTLNSVGTLTLPATLEAGHRRVLSVMVSTSAAGDSYSDSSEDYEFDTFAGVGSLDVYDGTLPAQSLMPLNSLNPIDAEDEGFLHGLQRSGGSTDHDVDFYGVHGGSGSPKSSSQIGSIVVSKWNEEFGGDDHGDEVSMSFSVSGNNSLMRPPLHKHTAGTKSMGYQFKDLKRQFFDVHAVELKETNYAEDDMEEEAHRDNDSDDMDMSREQSVFADFVDDEEREVMHIKRKSVMRTVEFDERFRKILQLKQRKDIDLQTAEREMIKRWNLYMNETRMDAHDLEMDAAMKCTELKEDSCCIRMAILIRFYHQWVYHDSHRVVEYFFVFLVLSKKTKISMFPIGK